MFNARRFKTDLTPFPTLRRHQHAPGIAARVRGGAARSPARRAIAAMNPGAAPAESPAGSLVCVGVGMTLGSHLTPLSRSYIESADVVFAATSDGIVELWLAKMNPDVRSLQPFYREGKSRAAELSPDGRGDAGRGACRQARLRRVLRPSGRVRRRAPRCDRAGAPRRLCRAHGARRLGRRLPVRGPRDRSWAATAASTSKRAS